MAAVEGLGEHQRKDGNKLRDREMKNEEGSATLVR